eukprot:75377_1
MDNETTRTEVRERHLELYNYSRALFEAIEFFGEEMSPTMKVYHGLNRVMGFEQFTTYFDQPVSTTPSLISAQQFSQNTGIILALKAGTKHFDDASKIPKYLNVSRFSDFPAENERLFYGAFVHFRISDIIVANNPKKSHSTELVMLNKFQSILQNQQVKLDKKTEDMIHSALTYRTNSIEYDKDYATLLFNYFCNKQKKIIIHDYQSLPESLKNVMLKRSINFHVMCSESVAEIKNIDEEHQTTLRELLKKEMNEEIFVKMKKKEFCDFINKSSVQLMGEVGKLYQEIKNKLDQRKISVCTLVKLFPAVEKIGLNGLNLLEMETKKMVYIDFVLDHIENDIKSDTNLESVRIQSKAEHHNNKPSEILRNIQTEYSQKFEKYKWKISYELSSEDVHYLEFVNLKYEQQQNINVDKNFLRSAPEIDKVKNAFDTIHSSSDSSDSSYTILFNHINKYFNQHNISDDASIS